MPKIFFATDLHGSEMCWRKFLNAGRFYDADILICGGDMTGKAIVPIVQENGHYTVQLGGESQSVEPGQVADVEAQIRRKGYYPLQMSLERLHELDQDPAKRTETFQQVMLDGVDRWMGMAAEKLRGTGIRIFVCPGNDDEMEVDEVIRRSDVVELGEGRVVDIDGWSMISTGWSNHTPWNTHREETEEKLGERIEAMASQLPDASKAIFNLHCPPFGPRRGARDRRGPEAASRRPGPPPGGFHRRTPGNRTPPATDVAARPHSREQGGRENRKDALHQSGKLVRGRNAYGRNRSARRQERNQELPAGQRMKR
jgi:Icc-related predicted phosphoesterase